MASKKESTFKNMLLVLFIITLLSSAILGFVYEKTKAPIANSKLKGKLEAITKVVPKYDNNPNAEMFTVAIEGEEPVEVYPAKDGDKLVGLAVKSYTNSGFSGLIVVMVGFTPDGTVYNYQVLDHKETPGLGSKMEDWFRPAVSEGNAVKKASFADWLFGIKPSAGGDNNSIINKNPSKTKFTVSKDGGDIDAITAATISSRAFLDAIDRGYKAWDKATKKMLTTNTEGGK